MDATIRFGKIHIIEWLAPGDAKTGWELFNDLQPMGLASKPRVEVSFNRVHTRDEFIAYLRTVEQAFRATKALPLLHIEAHGFRDGICSRTGDEVLWPELMQELVPLNCVTQLRLVLVLAACEGFWGVQMLQPVDRAAFFALLGPNQEISAAELLKGCLAFYRGVFQDGNGNVAFKAMNDAINPASPTFGIVNAQILFKIVYRRFLKELCSEQELSRRAERLVAKTTERFKSEHGVGMWAHEVAQVRTFVGQHLKAHDEYFEAFRRKFFFIDFFPENDRRFPVTIEDCREEPDWQEGDSGQAG